ncbi:ferritin-like domain-containing protein [Lacticaseibacillus parakribbianus]|uniref:ferritin-like domain-containing protein n=1 Tax=Lacticaseibacillus parakribbianus TaxID=2970927 RepID=UPI0021CB73DA|nr:ferritin-like domain-containing protein [Lacticaseibacillus parakribbianus]
MPSKEAIEAKYQAEVEQADRDHHKPTAGAMTGHILANLWVLDVKFHQALWFVHGPQSYQLQQVYTDLIAANRKQIDELGGVLLDENEFPPATVAEYMRYAKIEEEPRLKYEDAAQVVDQTAHDFTTANLFIDRAIKLAERESRPAMAAFLTGLRGYNNQQVRRLQAFLGKTAWEGLVEVDDDED